MAKNVTLTPLMKQYFDMKSQFPDALFLFRVGDFYELFNEDAIKASKILGITLTKRANGSASYVELAGFPHHSIETYMPKLILAGERVAICEQLEDPKKTKKIVKRGVTEIITPGVTLSDNVLNHSENNFLAAIHIDKKNYGIAFLDISTGEFLISEGNSNYINKLISNFSPKEIIYDKTKSNKFFEKFGDKNYSYPLDDWIFTEKAANERLLSHFNTKSLKGFGIEKIKSGIVSAGAIIEYLHITRHNKLSHINKISRIEEHKYVWLDNFTIKNLELFNSFNIEGKSLINILDKTASPMGARTMKRWLAMPLISATAIDNRLSVVEYFIQNSETKDEIYSYISQIGDLERLGSKIASMRVNPRELLQLKNSFEIIEPLKTATLRSKNEALVQISDQLNFCATAREKIEKYINNDAPNTLSKGMVISEGIDSELDELRNISFSGKDYLNDMCKRESERTGITSLKIGFNNVFGYFFEVRNMHKDKAPEEWTRKQTLSNAERYINEELKEYEGKILGAEDKISVLESKLYNELVISLVEYISTIQLNANLIAKLDCLMSFSIIAIENDYCKPEVNNSFIINIQEGRHPVIEKQLPIGEKYISNNIVLDPDSEQIIIITGPNMAGKSALLRQTALICLMAQIGSYVPAQTASIGVLDKVFTRVGASDNISLGESTFMVEMNEAANILNNVTSRSLILLDELGRGTSTYDGISIAWAITEYIHNHPSARAKTMFATHYHELNELEKTLNRIKNYNVSVKEIGDGKNEEKKILFLRKLVPGGSNHSFGIHVAKIAGMPKSVVKRAHEILAELEETRKNDDKKTSKKLKTISKKSNGFQMQLFEFNDPLLLDIKKQIESLDLNNTTPVEALNSLVKIKSLLTGKKIN